MRIAGVNDKNLRAVLQTLLSKDASQPQSYTGMNDIGANIMGLRCADDADRYIKTGFIGGKGAPVTMLRDARKLKVLHEPDDPSGLESVQVYTALIRDQRHSSKCYLMMALNYTAALELLLKAKKIPYESKVISELCDRMLVGAKIYAGSLEDYFYRYLKEILAPVMQQKELAKVELEAISILDKLKDWVAISQESINLATVDQLRDKRTGQSCYVIRIDEPICSLTDEEKEELKNYKNKPHWFEQLSPEEKLLFTEVMLDELLAGRVIPSQLRSRLPLMKNSYAHKTFVVSVANGEWVAEEVLSVNHSGALIYCDKNRNPNEVEMQRIADQNLMQQIQHAKNLSRSEHDRRWQNHIITLSSEHGDALRGGYEDWINWFKSKNGFLPSLIRIPLLIAFFVGYLALKITEKLCELSIVLLPFGKQIWNKLVYLYDFVTTPLNKLFQLVKAAKDFLFGTYKSFVGFDHHIVTKTRQAVAKLDHCYSSNICLNEFSKFESHDLSGIMQIYLQGTLLLAKLQSQREKDLADSLAQSLIKLKNKIGTISFLLGLNESKSNRTLFDRFSHYFLRLAEPIYRFISGLFDKQVRAMQIMGVIGLLAKQFDKAYEKLKDPAIMRINVWFNCASGENRTGLTEYHMQCEAVNKRMPTIGLAEIRKRLAMSGHVQKITGFQGGNAGMEGIRKKSMSSLPRDYDKGEFRKPGDQLQTPWSDMKEVAKKIEKINKHGVLSHDEITPLLMQRVTTDKWGAEGGLGSFKPSSQEQSVLQLFSQLGLFKQDQQMTMTSQRCRFPQAESTVEEQLRQVHGVTVC